MYWPVILAIAVASLVTHTFFSLSGLGGGIVLIPFFILLGFSVQFAAGAGLLMNIISLAIVSYHNNRHRYVMWDYVAAFSLPALIMAPIGYSASSAVDPLVIILIFIGILVYAFVHVILKLNPHHIEGLPKKRAMIRFSIGGGTGVVAGFLGGMIGVGGGLIILPVLTMVENDYKKIAATTAASAFFISCEALVSHISSILPSGFTTVIVVSVIATVLGAITASFALHRLKSRQIAYLTSGIIFIAIVLLTIKVGVVLGIAFH